MKILLEFENAEKFFMELPKFAALIGFSGQFADFEHVKKPDTTSQLRTPELPKISVNADGSHTLTGTDSQIGKVAKAAVEAGVAKTEQKKVPENPQNTQNAADGESSSDTVKASAPEKTPEKPAPQEAMPKPVDPPKDAPKITDVRKVLHAQIKAGHRDEMKSLLNKLGAKSVSTLDPDKFADFIAEANKIGGENA